MTELRSSSFWWSTLFNRYVRKFRVLSDGISRFMRIVPTVLHFRHLHVNGAKLYEAKSSPSLSGEGRAIRIIGKNWPSFRLIKLYFLVHRPRMWASTRTFKLLLLTSFIPQAQFSFLPSSSSYAYYLRLSRLRVGQNINQK